MAKYHIVANIEDLLSHEDVLLETMFDKPGKQIRKELEVLKYKGDIYIGSEGCKYFDPKLGCRCRFYEIEEGNK